MKFCEYRLSEAEALALMNLLGEARAQVGLALLPTIRLFKAAPGLDYTPMARYFLNEAISSFQPGGV